MSEVFYFTPPNEGIYVDGDDMWFVSISGDALCKGNRMTEEAEYIARTPIRYEGKGGWPSPSCVKYKDILILLPGLGKDIWRYDLKNKKFSKITTINPQHIRLDIFTCWIVGRTLWAWSGRFGGLRCLLEVDLEDCNVRHYYRIVEGNNLLFSWQPARSGDNVYIFENNSKKLYEFNLISKKTVEYNLDAITGVIVTICCDEDGVWLAGEEKCIYEWNRATERLVRYTNFPEEFQIIRTESPMLDDKKWSFCYSACLDKYVCFVPRNFLGMMLGGSGLVFMNKKDHTMRVVQLYDGIGNGIGVYKLEYVLEGRYIGVHYWPNGFISEIDTVDFTIREKRMRFSADSYMKF